jgi:hypothetical protein
MYHFGKYQTGLAVTGLTGIRVGATGIKFRIGVACGWLAG